MPRLKPAAPRVFHLQTRPVEGARFKKRKPLQYSSSSSTQDNNTFFFVSFAAVAVVALLYRPSHFVKVIRPIIIRFVLEDHLIYIDRQ